MSMDDVKIKTCPWCGSIDIRHMATRYDGRICRCHKCHAQGPVMSGEEIKGKDTQDTNRLRAAAAYKNWNTRAPINVLSDNIKFVTPSEVVE